MVILAAGLDWLHVIDVERICMNDEVNRLLSYETDAILDFMETLDQLGTLIAIQAAQVQRRHCGTPPLALVQAQRPMRSYRSGRVRA